MEPAADALWLNTLTAHAGAYPEWGGVHLGQYVLAMALVFFLLGALAWWVKRNQRSSGAEDAENEEEILFYSQFNARQTLCLTRRHAKVRCWILNGRQTELAIELPETWFREERPDRKKKPAAGPRSFQEIWAHLLRRHREPES